MTTDDGRVLAFVTMLHVAREDAKATKIAEEIAAKALREYLQTLPEGERELWDQEHDPPIGVGLKERGGRRWVEWAAVPDEAIVWAARQGLLEGINTTLFDALAGTTSQEVQAYISDIRPHLHQGTQETLVLLPERRGR
jgi:hypothetical protein